MRDKSRLDKTEHLLALNGRGVGKVELYEADMLDDGAYDSAFEGCSCVFHIAADLGHDVGGHIAAAGQTVGQSGVDLYNSIVDSTKNVLGSIERSGSVTRLVYTSSGGVYMHPTSRFQPARAPSSPPVRRGGVPQRRSRAPIRAGMSSPCVPLPEPDLSIPLPSPAG